MGIKWRRQSHTLRHLRYHWAAAQETDAGYSARSCRNLGYYSHRICIHALPEKVLRKERTRRSALESLSLRRGGNFSAWNKESTGSAAHPASNPRESGSGKAGAFYRRDPDKTRWCFI